MGFKATLIPVGLKVAFYYWIKSGVVTNGLKMTMILIGLKVTLIQCDDDTNGVKNDVNVIWG